MDRQFRRLLAVETDEAEALGFLPDRSRPGDLKQPTSFENSPFTVDLLVVYWWFNGALMGFSEIYW